MASDESHLELKEAYYDEYASFYDSIIDARYRKGGDNEETGGAKDFDREAEFYVEQVKQTDGPVLEVGCGTGRIYLEMLREGVDAYGFDISEEMLDNLRRRSADEPIEPQVWRAEMQTFTPQREYESVIIPGRGFLHNTSREDQRRTLENIHDALAPGGELICNFYTVDYEALADHTGTNDHDFEHDGETYTVITEEEYEDKVHNVVSGTQTIKDGDGDVVTEFSTRIKLVSKDEFALLLDVVGFDDWELYGSFDLDPHNSVEDEMIWIATA